ncbi:MAG: NAD(P)-dependent oxidoreductase [Sphingomonadales bacterium]|nr:NAD(P)-dependent oxidoreductase [Sphingomonadales bacterium]
MKVLVTGSAGHLGEGLMRTLGAHGHEAVGLDLLPGPFTQQVGSITDRAFVREALESVDAVLHTATLHKPHVATHSKQDFVDTNVTGTLVLLEEAVAAGVSRFVFTSTTSAFGAALTPPAGAPAAWIDETVRPVPKNIYGVTKTANEDLCELFHRKHGLSCLILRTSRFFPEEDDNKAVRESFADMNAKANEFLFRRVDLEDAVSAHVAALARAPEIGFARYIVSATTPFAPDDMAAVRADPATVVTDRFPQFAEIYRELGFKMFASIDRVYVNEKARTELRWRPKYDFGLILEHLADGAPIGSDLARTVGIKGYHQGRFADGLYPVESPS